MVFVCYFHPHGILFLTTPFTPLLCTHIAPATSQTIDLVSDPVRRGLCQGARHSRCKILPKTVANISCHALQPLRQPLRHWLRFWLPQYFSRAGPFARNRSEPKVGFGSTPTSEIAPISLVEREIYSSLLVFPHAKESIASDPRHLNLNSP